MEKLYHKAKLSFIDSGSLTYEIETNYVHKDFHKEEASLILVNMQKIQNFMVTQSKT